MCLCCLLLLVALGCGTAANPYILDDTGGLGRVFDGIGGLSGGGVSCMHLWVHGKLMNPIKVHGRVCGWEILRVEFVI